MNPTNENTAAVVLAAGKGKRMNTQVAKQYLELAGRPLLYHSLKAFEDSEIEEIVLVTGEDEIEYCQKEIAEAYSLKKIKAIVAGGKERYHSVFAGLKAIGSADYVLIHDGARPFLTQEIIERSLAGAVTYGACVAGMPVKDTIKILDDRGFSAHTPNRELVWMMQTPQAFSFPLIEQAYAALLEREQKGENLAITDDAMVLELVFGKQVRLVEGSYENIKITTPSDLEIAEVFAKRMELGKFGKSIDRKAYPW